MLGPGVLKFSGIFCMRAHGVRNSTEKNLTGSLTPTAYMQVESLCDLSAIANLPVLSRWQNTSC